MAVLHRSKDHSIWLSHIDDSSGDVLPVLDGLAPGQDVVLRIGEQEGTWTRFRSLPNGSKSSGFKCKDDNAKRIWNSISIGKLVPLQVVCVINANDASSSSPTTDSLAVVHTDANLSPSIEYLNARQEGTILCIGVDVAWWGGQKKSKDSRCESLAYSLRNLDGWGDLGIETIDLNPAFNPNADPWTPNADEHGKLLSTSLLRLIDRFSHVDRVVIALDVPILAQDRELPPPRKANPKGESGGVYRQCDQAWMTARASSPNGWLSVNVLPGAPIVPRCKSLLQKLHESGFEVFGLCEADHPRQLIECFPNEIVWSIGALGLDKLLRPDSFQQYKRLGKKNLPLGRELFHASWRLTVERTMELAELDGTVIKRWLHQFENWLEDSCCFDREHRIGLTGKAFDDAVESVLSLIAAVAFVDGTSHVHRGNDPEDGHIIGPGRNQSGK